MSCVYGLISTKEPDRIRYIGISKNDDANKRLASHLRSARSDKRLLHLPVYKWINKHEFEGHAIGYVIIDSGLSWGEACHLEMEHIREYRLLDDGMLNMTDGGEGFYGGNHSEESREKMRAYWTLERREAQRERTKNRPAHIFTEEELQRMSEIATSTHKKRRESGLVWGLDVGPKDKTPKAVKDRIINERNAGKSFNQISDGLNKDEVPTANGGKWYPTSVKNIVDRQNPKKNV
jgi:hypothetical protein